MKFLKITLQACLICVCLTMSLFAAALGVARLKGWHFYRVATSSMMPTLHPGDMIVVSPISFPHISSGDIVSYWQPATQKIVTHRVIAADIATDAILTKGDANSAFDAIVRYQAVQGRVEWRVPFAGVALERLHSYTGLIGFVYLPALMLVLLELRRLHIRAIHRRSYYHARALTSGRANVHVP